MDKEYVNFLNGKVKFAERMGMSVDISEVNPRIRPHNKLMVKWMVEGGKRACFANFGLGKTVTQLEVIRLILKKSGGGKGLIICPLGVRQEFKRDAVNILKWENPPKFIRNISEASEDGIYLTNYETVRDGKLDPHHFVAVSLDEASVLRGLGGSKTFREFMRLFTGDEGVHGNRRGAERVKYRFVATATPSPNDYIELLAYADFLGIMDIGQAKTRFFKRDSTHADKLTLHGHKEEEFWLWVSSWAIFVTKPSDITLNPKDDVGYVLPELKVRWHEVKSNHAHAGKEKNGQLRLFMDCAIGVQGASMEKRDSLGERIKKMKEILSDSSDDHFIIWHDLEDERHAIKRAVPGAVSVYGSQDLDKREQNIIDFSDGLTKILATKPILSGSGCNFQRYCHRAIYLGIGFKFNDFIQSVHRIHRFLQTEEPVIDIIYTEAEDRVKKILEKKWKNHNTMVKKMTDIVKKYGLSKSELSLDLIRKMGTERIECSGKHYTIVNNDNVTEMPNISDNSIGLILTSVPFATQYEYSPNFCDFGHSENNAEFFRQMDFLTPHLYRVLMPGRILAVHVKDRIIPSGITGNGFQEVYPFHSDCISHYKKHGFGFLGMKTIVTDVVRENNQTYRLGWTEQCKDGSKMGVGMPEYLLLFRKPATDTSNGYADIPVLKQKREWDAKNKRWTNEGYSRARWQIDAHGFERVNGNRFLDPEEIAGMEPKMVFRSFREWTLNNIYNFEHHVKIAERLEEVGKLPSGFMLLQPYSWTDEVWTDIARMRTLNCNQKVKGKQLHLCPLQFNIVERVIAQMSNEGDIVLDPFGGLMTVPYMAIKMKRYGYGIELNDKYFLDGMNYCKAAEMDINVPSLFDVEEIIS